MKIQSYNYAAVGARVRAARKARKYTQEYLADQVDIDCQNISNIERGVCGLSVATLISLCRTLGVSADYLLFGSASGGNPLDGAYSGLNERQKKFVEDFVALYAESVK